MSPQELDRKAREAQLKVDAERAKKELARIIEREQEKEKNNEEEEEEMDRLLANAGICPYW